MRSILALAALLPAAAAALPNVAMTDAVIIEALPTPQTAALLPAAGDDCDAPGDLQYAGGLLLCHGGVLRKLSEQMVPTGECAPRAVAGTLDVQGATMPESLWGAGRANDGTYYFLDGVPDQTCQLFKLELGSEPVLLAPTVSGSFQDGPVPGTGHMQEATCYGMEMDALANVVWVFTYLHTYHLDLTSNQFTKVDDNQHRPGHQLVDETFPLKNERGVLAALGTGIQWCGAVTMACETILTGFGVAGFAYFPPLSNGDSAFVVAYGWADSVVNVREIDSDPNDSDDYTLTMGSGTAKPAGCLSHATITLASLVYDPSSDSALGFESNSGKFLRIQRATNEADWTTSCVTQIDQAAGTHVDGAIPAEFDYKVAYRGGMSWDAIDGTWIFGSRGNGGIRTMCPPLPAA